MKHYKICPRCQHHNSIEAFDCEAEGCGIDITHVDISESDINDKEIEAEADAYCIDITHVDTRESNINDKLTLKFQNEIITIVHGVLKISTDTFQQKKNKIIECLSTTEPMFPFYKDYYYINIDQLSEIEREELKSICTNEYPKLFIGRAGIGSHILKNNKFVSAIHAEFIRNFEKWYIKDYSSKNGTFINNKKISHGKQMLINTDDEIQLSKACKLIVM